MDFLLLRHRLYVFILVSIYFKLTDMMNYTIVDKSTSKSCESGVLEGVDMVRLDVEVYTPSENITEDSVFRLLVQNPVTNYTKELCSLKYTIGCNEAVEQGCFCVNNAGDAFSFVYQSAANLDYSRFLLKINGDTTTADVKYPEVFQVDPVVKLVTHDVVLTDMEDCLVPTPKATSQLFTFCVTGLSAPVLFVTYANVTRHASSKFCISVRFTLREKFDSINFRYLDKCRRNASFWCTLQGSLSSTTRKATSVTSTTDSDIIIEVNLAKAMLLLITLVLVLAVFMAVVFHLRKKASQSRYRATRSSMDAVPVVVNQSATSNKSSSSVLGRLTQRFSVWSPSSKTRIQPPLTIEEETWGTPV